MDDKESIINAYLKMYEYMIDKNENGLKEVLDESFVLKHMTGMKQNRKEFIEAINKGTLNYYSARHDNLSIQAIDNNEATLIGQSYVEAAVFGGSKSFWSLKQTCKLKKIQNEWKIIYSSASTY